MPRYIYTVRFMSPAGRVGEGGIVYQEPVLAQGASVILIWSNLFTFNFNLNVNGVSYPFQQLNVSQKSGGLGIMQPNTLLGIYTPPGEPGLQPTDARLAVANGPTLTMYYAPGPEPAAGNRWAFVLPRARFPSITAGGTLQVTGPSPPL